ncbi:uncharacterized protein RBU33_007159 isoform 3-T3 [Hipposideros larvatus]
MKVAVARAGAAAVRARGAECGGGGGSWSLEPGAPAEAGAGRDGSTAWTSLHCRQSWGWTGWESRKWTPFSWERECQPPAKGARDCSPLEENDVSRPISSKSSRHFQSSCGGHSPQSHAGIEQTTLLFRARAVTS